MAKRKSRRTRKRAKRFLWIITGILVAITLGMAVFMLILARQESIIMKPDELLVTYMSYIQEKKYEEMYQMLDMDASGQSSEEDLWFAVFTAESTEEHPILIISMVEDVKGRGGSGYVVGKDKEVLESWFSGNK